MPPLSPSIKRQITRLLALGAPLEHRGRTFATWHGLERQPDGAVTFPFPVYDTDVSKFFAAAQGKNWMDTNYDQNRCAERIADDGYIASATLAQLKELLTYCVRGERFCDGHWEGLLEKGRIAGILGRLRVIRDEGSDDQNASEVSVQRSRH